MVRRAHPTVVFFPALQEFLPLRGVGERDKKGFNRFRLVFVTSRPDELRGLAEQAFNSSGYTDEKTHLHIASESDVESL